MSIVFNLCFIFCPTESGEPRALKQNISLAFFSEAAVYVQLKYWNNAQEFQIGAIKSLSQNQDSIFVHYIRGLIT